MLTSQELILLEEQIEKEKQTRNRCDKETPESKRRTVTLTIKISQEEMAHVKEVSGGNVSDYVRKMILGEKADRKLK